jgi:hypothetical protein
MNLAAGKEIECMNQWGVACGGCEIGPLECSANLLGGNKPFSELSNKYVKSERRKHPLSCLNNTAAVVFLIETASSGSSSTRGMSEGNVERQTFAIPILFNS